MKLPSLNEIYKGLTTRTLCMRSLRTIPQIYDLAQAIDSPWIVVSPWSTPNPIGISGRVNPLEAEDGRRPVLRRGCYNELKPSLRCGGHMRERPWLGGVCAIGLSFQEWQFRKKQRKHIQKHEKIRENKEKYAKICAQTGCSFGDVWSFWLRTKVCKGCALNGSMAPQFRDQPVPHTRRPGDAEAWRASHLQKMLKTSQFIFDRVQNI